MVISVLKSVLLGEIFVRSKVMENENNSSFLLMNGWCLEPGLFLDCHFPGRHFPEYHFPDSKTGLDQTMSDKVGLDLHDIVRLIYFLAK